MIVSNSRKFIYLRVPRTAVLARYAADVELYRSVTGQPAVSK